MQKVPIPTPLDHITRTYKELTTVIIYYSLLDREEQKDMSISKNAKTLVYISSHASCEQDIVDDLLNYLFGLNICPYMWEKNGDLSENFLAEKPDYVIISPALPDIRITNIYSEQEVWDIVRNAFPTVPVLWLAPDEHNIPDFLPPESDSFAILPTEGPRGCIERFIDLLSTLTDIKPRINLAPATE